MCYHARLHILMTCKCPLRELIHMLPNSCNSVRSRKACYQASTTDLCPRRHRLLANEAFLYPGSTAGAGGHMATRPEQRVPGALGTHHAFLQTPVSLPLICNLIGRPLPRGRKVIAALCEQLQQTGIGAEVEGGLVFLVALVEVGAVRGQVDGNRSTALLS